MKDRCCPLGSLFEMHFHTSQTSPCGRVPGQDGVLAYKERGYDGIVVTDHYYDGYFEEILPDMSWEDKLDHWLEGYRAAKAAGDACGMTVLLGMELRFSGSNNDYLVYGVTEDFLLSHPRLYRMNLASFSQLAGEEGFWWAQAHPFRPWVTPCEDPRALDGAEVHNTNPRQENHNDLASAWAEKNDLPGIAGSDFHQIEDLALAGVRFEAEIDSQEALLRALKASRTGPQWELITCVD